MKKVHELAKAYLSESNEKIADSYKTEALAILKDIPFTTLAKSLDEVGISYIGSINSSAKIEKNMKKNYYTYIIYLLPAKASGFEVCPVRSEACTKLCLNTSGRVKLDKYNTILTSRLVKTWLYFGNRELFSNIVFAEMAKASAKAKKDKALFSARLNGTSDINIETIKISTKDEKGNVVSTVNVLEKFSDVQFYDYTKVMSRFKLKEKYSNYDLTFSYSGTNLEETKKALGEGIRVAIPFLINKGKALPETFLGYEVGDADETDLRFLDEKPIAGLRVKRIKDKAIEKESFQNDDFVIDLSKEKWNF